MKQMKITKNMMSATTYPRVNSSSPNKPYIKRLKNWVMLWATASTASPST
jgi:hypothetical protein